VATSPFLPIIEWFAKAAGVLRGWTGTSHCPGGIIRPVSRSPEARSSASMTRWPKLGELAKDALRPNISKLTEHLGIGAAAKASDQGVAERSGLRLPDYPTTRSTDDEQGRDEGPVGTKDQGQRRQPGVPRRQLGPRAPASVRILKQYARKHPRHKECDCDCCRQMCRDSVIHH